MCPIKKNIEVTGGTFRVGTFQCGTGTVPSVRYSRYLSLEYRYINDHSRVRVPSRKSEFFPERFVIRYATALADDRCEMLEKRSMISCPHRPQQGRCNSHRSMSKYGIRVKK
jgi:hypothetical protein